MTVKRRFYRKLFGKRYPTQWERVKQEYKEPLSVCGKPHTLIASKDGDSIYFVPHEIQGEQTILDLFVGENINRLSETDRFSVLYSIGSDGLEDKKIELAWEPTLPSQAKK